MSRPIWGLSLGLVLAAAGAVAAPAADTAADPALEARVQAVAAELRCLVCQNQTLADSHAPLAVDLKNQVREQLQAGRSPDEVVDHMTSRYGDFVRYRPPWRAGTVVLWAGPFVLLIVALAALFRGLGHRRQGLADPVPLPPKLVERVDLLLNGPREVAQVLSSMPRTRD